MASRLTARADDLAHAHTVAAALGARLRRVILFGSRARGDALEDSDLDILILVDRRDRAVKRAVDEAASPLYPLFVDVQVFTPERWGWSLSADAPLLRHALEEGIEVWPPRTTA